MRVNIKYKIESLDTEYYENLENLIWVYRESIPYLKEKLVKEKDPVRASILEKKIILNEDKLRNAIMDQKYIYQSQVNRNFSIYELDKDQMKNADVIREKTRILAHFIIEHLEPSREMSTALTKLEEVVFWAVAGVARYPKIGISEIESENLFKESEDESEDKDPNRKSGS